jgi:hypothetical protein
VDIELLQVCRSVGAQLLIDDSAENALACVSSDNPMPVILFGDYQWNQRAILSSSINLQTDLSFDARLQLEGDREFWKDDDVEFPEGSLLWRVKDWDEAVDWIAREGIPGRTV